MKSVVVCPECKKLVYFNSYFGAYICDDCGWEDASFAQKRDSYVEIQTTVKVMRSAACTTMILKKRLSKDKKEISLQNERATVG